VKSESRRPADPREILGTIIGIFGSELKIDIEITEFEKSRRATMKSLHRILPAFAIVVALGAAIYHVRASAMERPQVVERPAAADLNASGAPGSLLPPSSRYSGSSAAN